MKTEIVEIEQTKKFKPFKLELTIETEEEAKEILEQLAKATGKHLFKPYSLLNNHLKLMGIS